MRKSSFVLCGAHQVLHEHTGSNFHNVSCMSGSRCGIGAVSSSWTAVHRSFPAYTEAKATTIEVDLAPRREDLRSSTRHHLPATTWVESWLGSATTSLLGLGGAGEILAYPSRPAGCSSPLSRSPSSSLVRIIIRASFLRLRRAGRSFPPPACTPPWGHLYPSWSPAMRNPRPSARIPRGCNAQQGHHPKLYAAGTTKRRADASQVGQSVIHMPRRARQDTALPCRGAQCRHYCRITTVESYHRVAPELLCPLPPPPPRTCTHVANKTHRSSIWWWSKTGNVEL